MSSDLSITLAGVAITTALIAVLVLRKELLGFVHRHYAAIVDVAAVIAISGVLANAPFIAKGPTGLTFECKSALVVSPPARGAVICEANLQQLAIRLGLVIAVWAVMRFRKFR